MDQREQMNRPEAPQADEERAQRQRRQAERIAQDGPSIRAENIMAARKAMERIEDALNAGTRVPFKNHLSMVNVGDVLNLVSELRSSLPDAVEEAAEIIKNKQQIEFNAQQRAQEKTSQATISANERLTAADAQARQMVEDAQMRAMEIEQQARATAERILTDANAQAQMLTEDSEITRRAHARAKEIFDQVQLDVDGMYKTACTEVNKMLSGATAALNRSAMEMAALRDQLLNPGGADPNAR